MKFIVELNLDTEMEVFAKDEDKAVEKALKQITKEMLKDECYGLHISVNADEEDDGNSGCDIKTL